MEDDLKRVAGLMTLGNGDPWQAVKTENTETCKRTYSKRPGAKRRHEYDVRSGQEAFFREDMKALMEGIALNRTRFLLPFSST